jgi:membrane-bound metal-dependent hydrolase YbcI (DUF457 family)
MMGPTHKLVGGSTGFMAATSVGQPLIVGVLAGLLAGMSSSLPDDLEKFLKVQHRTITHYPSVQLAALGSLAGLIIAVSAIPDVVVLAFLGIVAIGCVMHSFADAMTVDPRGIALLWPIRRRGYHLLPRWARVWVGTKSRSEWAFVIVWSTIVLSYLYARYRHHISA